MTEKLPTNPTPVFVTDFNGVEVVRVKDTVTKHEYTTGRAAFETAAGGLVAINKPALNGDGTHAPAKPFKDLSAK